MTPLPSYSAEKMASELLKRDHKEKRNRSLSVIERQKGKVEKSKRQSPVHCSIVHDSLKSKYGH